MPNVLNDVEIAFYHDVDEIAEKAIAAYGLEYSKSADNNGLHAAVLRWADFALRYVAPTPRQIVLSDKFPLTLPPEPEQGLHRIERMLINGEDINAYQSRTLTEFNDTSGRKSQKRTDGLWADWGIHHLHLPEHPVKLGETYSERSDWLLFLMVYNNVALFIDVKEHSEENLFSMKELVHTYIRSWPEDAERYQLKGVLGVARPTPPSDAEHKQLRQSGINTMLEVDGRVYAGPGMGVTTAVTSTRVGLSSDRIRSNARQVAREVARPGGLVQQTMQSLGIASPDFHLALNPEGTLGVHEQKSNMYWALGQSKDQQADDAGSALRDAFMPAWAGQKVAKYWIDNP